LDPSPQIEQAKPLWSNIIKVLYIIGTLVLFVFALDLMVASLQHLGQSAAETIILATSNPFTGLFIGLLITAMIQSSSTTTAIVVALVASGSITIESAIPIIMGANIGTTITSTIVSLGFISKKKEFRRAAAAGTYHDFFNILTAFILFPLEYYYGFLSGISQYITSYFFTPSHETVTTTYSISWSGFKVLVDGLVEIIGNGFILALLAFTLLFSSILVFRKLISGLFLTGQPERFSSVFFKNHLASFFWGTATTAAIRSSTITTSLVVPLVAQRIITLKNAAPFILGANIGTTITAFIAAILNSNSSSAISIAVSHFLFNFIGVLIFYPIPLLRKLPMELANRLGRLTLKYRLAGFVYILLTFFFIPFSLIYLNRDSVEIVELTYVKINSAGNESTYRLISKMQVHNHSGEHIIYSGTAEEPSLIYPVLIKNNILFINEEMYFFNKPGFCWDGENAMGKYKMCIDEILPSLALSPKLQFDSVYVYSRTYYHASDSSVRTRIFIDRSYPFILKQVKEKASTVIEKEGINSLSVK
jgi:sodium-dependent phosphate cotransporter